MSDGNSIRHRSGAKRTPLAQANNLAPTRRQNNELHSNTSWARLLFIVGLFAILVLSAHKSNDIPLRAPRDTVIVASAPSSPDTKINNAPTELNRDKCSFRSYPPSRLYGLSSKSRPKFLSEAAYIRGQWPIILLSPNANDDSSTPGKDSVQRENFVSKVCFDTTSWEDLKGRDGGERLPFTDGHNPSLVSLAPNPYRPDDSRDKHTRLNHEHLKPLSLAFPSIPLKTLFLGVSTFGGGQCKFGLSPEEVEKYRFSLHEEPPGGKRAMIALFSPPNLGSASGVDLEPSDHQSPFRTLAQTTLLLERDADYGTKRRKAIKTERSGSGFARMHQEFDDARLFFHLGRVWVLYRNGPLFGYETQAHNPVHFEDASDADDASGVTFAAFVKASETVLIDGGRNLALISEEPMGRNANGELGWVSSPSLKALTWVDPVTVKDDINMQGLDALLMTGRRLQEGSRHVSDSDRQRIDSPVSGGFSESLHESQHRRLGARPNSHIHGTNGYMVPLTSTGELFGIAHFHRPENREKSDFALHGHHYTHAFFTIAREIDESMKDIDINSRPFKLRRISNEFVFRANSIPSGEIRPPLDSDIIQFASGLDVLGSDVDGQVIISYGINDCEGAVLTMSMEKVQQMLRDVDYIGQEVVDLMMAVS
jgi:hypothetical protein